LISVGYEKKLAYDMPMNVPMHMPMSITISRRLRKGKTKMKIIALEESIEPVTRKLFPETWLFESICDLG
jgi:hypothetical protein